jgi:hypothetical protein
MRKGPRLAAGGHHSLPETNDLAQRTHGPAWNLEALKIFKEVLEREISANS